MKITEPIELAIRNAKRMPKQKGKSAYLKFLSGEKVTRADAIFACCYECVGGEQTKPCTAITCPLTLYCQWNDVHEVQDSNQLFE